MLFFFFAFSLFGRTTWELMKVADYSTSVRIFEALREKTENKPQYDAYVKELKPVREELGISPFPF
jgi:Cytochrome c oxidase subunit Va